MNWRNPFLTGYLAVTVIGVGVLGYLVYSSATRYAEVTETYDTQVLKLHQLQNRKPFPSPENAETFRKLTEQYRSEYDRLLATLTKSQRPLEAITPQAFQDRLRDFVSAVTAAARTNNVTLAENFYLGFDQYRDALPTNEAAPALARELDSVRLVVDRLIEFKVKGINGIKRDLLPEEPGGAKPEPTPRPRLGANTPPPPGPGVVSSNSFTISFVADQGQLRQALNSIVTADRFFIIRSLNLQNDKLEGPLQKEDTTDAALPVTDPLAAAPAPAGPSMRLLVGRELITAAVRIEVVQFNPPTAAASR